MANLKLSEDKQKEIMEVAVPFGTGILSGILTVFGIKALKRRYDEKKAGSATSKSSLGGL